MEGELKATLSRQKREFEEAMARAKADEAPPISTTHADMVAFRRPQAQESRHTDDSDDLLLGGVCLPPESLGKRMFPARLSSVGSATNLSIERSNRASSRALDATRGPISSDAQSAEDEVAEDLVHNLWLDVIELF